MVLDLIAQLDAERARREKTENLLRQLLAARSGRSSERLSEEQLALIEDICVKYACSCTVTTASKPPQPIEKSTAGASLLTQVIVAKYADHLPLNRQQRIFGRFGVDLSRQTLCGWMGQCAELLD